MSLAPLLEPAVLALSLAKEKLTALGFKKRSAEIYTRPVGADALAWIGMNRKAYRDGTLDIHPVVGVRHQEVERLVAELTGAPAHAYVPPTLSSQLGYLAPAGRFKSWTMRVPSDCEPEIGSMLGEIEAYGVPFAEAHAPLAALCQALRAGGHGVHDQTIYRVPVVHLLLGEKDDGRRYIDEQLAELGVRSDPAAEYYRAFAAAFSAR